MNKKTAVVLLLAFTALFALGPAASALGFDTEDIYDSVFLVYSGDSLGSGFSLAENCIITNAHVLTSGEQTTIKTYRGTTHRAEVAAYSGELDLAVLFVIDSVFPYLTAAPDEPGIGDDVYAVGAPNHLDYTLTKGIISSRKRVIAGCSYIQANIALSPGNSGGPLLNAEGGVIGVNTLKLSETEGIGFAIPIEAVFDYLSSAGIEITEEGRVEVSAARDEAPHTPEPEDVRDAGYTIEPPGERAPVNRFLLAGVVILIALSVCAVFAVYRSGRRVKKIDPSERTDFDIDVGE